MDFRNLCSKIDVDALRAKLPPLPDMVSQIKMPKSMSKLKSRKIFRSSREDISADAKHSNSKRFGSTDSLSHTDPYPLPPPSEFVDHIPHRISTISSLVDQPGQRGSGGGRNANLKRQSLDDDEEESFYRSAGGIEDYCPSPLRSMSTKPTSNSPPGISKMSPGRRTTSEQNVKMSFSDRMQKGYKDASEFRLKHIFVKKTVVRQDTIQVNEYVHRFEEDRRRQAREEELREQALEDDFNFDFKVSRRKSEESFGISTPTDSPIQSKSGNKKNLSEQSGDESGMEQSPPRRKPGIASTRFSRVRKVPLRMSLDEDDGIQNNYQNKEEDEEEDEEVLDFEDCDVEMKKAPPVPLHPIESSLYSKLNQRRSAEKPPEIPSRTKSIKQRLSGFKNVSQDENVSLSSGSPLGNRNKSMKKRLPDPRYKSVEESLSLSSGSPLGQRNKPHEWTEPELLATSPEKLHKSKSIKKRLGDLRNIKREVSVPLSSGSPLDGFDKRNQPKDSEKAEKRQRGKSIKQRFGDLKNASQEVSLSLSSGSPTNLFSKFGRRKETEANDKSPEKPSKSKSIKKRLGDHKDASQEVSLSLSSGSPLGSPKGPKRKAPLSAQNSEEDKPETKKPLGAIKQNIKRFQKSMKLPSSGSANQSTAESELDEPDSGKVKTSKSQQFAERLKRFRSVENVNKQTEDEAEEKKSSDPRLQKLTIKLQDWKKSFKKKPPSDTHNTDDDDDDEVNSPQKRDKPSGILMKRLQYIRNRKHHSTDDPDDDEEGGTSYRESFKSRAKLQLEKGVAAAQHVPQMTIDKFKESKKYFRKKQDKDKYKETESKTPKIPERDSGESALEESDEEPHAKPNRKYGEQASRNQDTAKHALTKHYYSSDDEDDEEGADAVEATKVTLEPYEQNVLVPLTRATWTAKPILSDSDGEEDDDILPRVLIHQDNSDVFESTLIIAVTRPIVTRSHTNSPYITELPPDYEDSPKASSTDSAKPSSPETKADNWKPNRESISNFTIGSPDMEGKLSKHDSLQSFSSRSQHSRKHSVDSSSEDSWIKDVPRDLSTAIGLNNLTEVEEPWRIKMDREPQEKLYKAKSIDIFEIHQTTHGEDLHIFEDFDDELRNTPIVSIEKDEDMQEHQRSSNESFDQDDSSEGMECADDDNSSRITKILKQTDSEEKNDEEKPERPKITSHVYDNGQDNNTLVITTIVKQHETEEKKVEKLSENPRITSPLFSNSRESLMGVPDQNRSTDDSGDEEDNEYSSNDEEDEADDDLDRPPSKNPSPPPPVSPPPPPPPLPQRQPSLRLSKLPKSSQQTLDSSPMPFVFPKSPLQQKSSPQSPPQPSSPILWELPKSPLLQKILANAEESISMPPSEAPPALPQSKPPPPIPPNRTVGFPPKIPERTPSMSKVARPLVKTASLRLAYSEQVNPEDVGKVNKLISRFEPNGRPRIVVRKPYISQDSEEYSDEEEEDDEVKPIEELESKNKKAILARIEDELNDNLVISSRNITADRTPTNKPILQKSLSIEIPDLPLIAAPMALVMRTGQQPEPQVNRGRLEDKLSSKPNRPPPPQITTSQPSPTKIAATSIANNNNVSCNTGYQATSIFDTNSNFSQPNSEYGSPMDYPSSLMGSAEVTPVTGRRDTELLNISQRSRRSMTRDEERFYSFDSDEENSYYSISSTGSSRYVVEL